MGSQHRVWELQKTALCSIFLLSLLEFPPYCKCSNSHHPQTMQISGPPSLIASVLSLTSSLYLSQFQEHEDIPIDICHQLGCLHQARHRVLFCDTQTQWGYCVPLHCSRMWAIASMA